MFSVLSSDHFDEWDRIVKSFPNHDSYYLPGYVKAFQRHGDGEPLLFYFQEGAFRAANVVMKRDLAHDGHFQGKIEANTIFDLATPYGYGGFLLDGAADDLSTLNEAYLHWCMENGIVSEFVRFHPVLENAPALREMYEVVDLGRTIQMELQSEEQIWAGLTSKNRNVIRKARKSGVEIFWGRSPELMVKFKSMYDATMAKDEAAAYYYFKEDFYQSVLHDIKNNFLIFYAVYANEIIAMAIILFANGQMHYHLSASDRNFQSLAATNLLLYEAACWGLEHGCRSFHLGGGVGSREDNLLKFKEAFHKDSKTRFAIGKKIFNAEKYRELTELRKKELGFDGENTFFPLYRG